MSESHARFVGSIPELYDEHLGPLFFRHHGEDLARRIDVGEGGRVLETACGTGIVTEILREALAPGVEIVATDLNEPMLEFARSRRGGLEGVRFEQADAGSLSFPDASFDAVVCQFGIMFFPDKPAALRESRRVLRPGGRLVFNVWDAIDHNPIVRIAHETVSRFFDDEPPSFLRTPFGYHDIDAVLEVVQGAGFEDVAAETLATVVERPSPRSLAIGLVEGNPGIAEIRERAKEPPDRIVDAVAEAIGHELGTDPVRVPLQAIVFSAVRG